MNEPLSSVLRNTDILCCPACGKLIEVPAIFRKYGHSSFCSEVGKQVEMVRIGKL